MFNKRRTAFLILILPLLLCLQLDAASRSEPEIEEAIRNQLVQRHPNDTPEWWRALGPAAPRVIMRMADASTDIYHRTRLIGALAWFGESAEVAEFLKKQAQETEDTVIRNSALNSLGLSQGAAGVPVLESYLGDGNAQTRLAAARALQRIAKEDRAAKIALDEYLAREKVPWVQSKLRGELPAPSKGLSEVSRSGDRLSRKLEGSWQGFFVFSGAGKETLKSVPARFLFRIENGNRLGGTLLLPPGKPGDPEVSIPVRELRGKGVHLRGLLPRELAGTEKDIRVEGTLVERSGSELLELDAEKPDGWLRLKKIK